MAEEHKSKTKAVILQELESIKGLLLEDDDIPLLQEVIDTAEEQTGAEDTLDGDDLAELQLAYRDLLQARDMSHDVPTLEEQEEQEPPILHDIEAPAKDEQAGLEEYQPEDSPAKELSPREEVQTSLFDMDSPLADQAPAKEPSPGLKRPSVTKASGENPFLPAHIRERLHGNRPPPLFEPVPPAFKPKPTPEAPPTVTPVAPTQNPNLTQLVEDVVASVLPEAEATLRRKLSELSAEQLHQMLENARSEDEPDSDNEF
ncbi:hypothetical protein [Marinimicrobium sp. ABcell2]|uniref:hypothetical protein n=1 Tax=Marinimicrobium sp. ABcell2 TaxID=3069751 RepID=UPI0027B6CD18|nr:hypothetical protein [Marinimicrobium sp. ABcell2]MDQ2077240.1 hypothetical protein [Marinimicrobium sp. ABcell2]